MSKALSVDLRERVVRAVSAGASCRSAAARFGVSASSAIRWCARLRATGSILPGALGGDRRSSRIEVHAALILQLVKGTPDITPGELRATLASSGVTVGVATLWRFLDRHELTLKKSRCTRPSRTDLMSKKRRRAWFEGQLDLEPERLVFIDETWASTKMVRTHGRAHRGERLRAAVPHGHWKTTTPGSSPRAGSSSPAYVHPA
jgi:transposase